jgi:hypothetical protein
VPAPTPDRAPGDAVAGDEPAADDVIARVAEQVTAALARHRAGDDRPGSPAESGESEEPS